MGNFWVTHTQTDINACINGDAWIFDVSEPEYRLSIFRNNNVACGISHRLCWCYWPHCLAIRWTCSCDAGWRSWFFMKCRRQHSAESNSRFLRFLKKTQFSVDIATSVICTMILTIGALFFHSKPKHCSLYWNPCWIYDDSIPFEERRFCLLCKYYFYFEANMQQLERRTKLIIINNQKRVKETNPRENWSHQNNT